MINFTASLEVYDLDFNAFDRTFKKNMVAQMKIAGQKFLSAALKMIPIFNSPSGGRESDYSTGFVAGAFGNLKQAVGGYGAEIPSGRFVRSKDRTQEEPLTANLLHEFFSQNKTPHQHSYISELSKRSRTITVGGRPVRIRINPYYYSPNGKILKTPRSGAQFATPPDKVLTFNKQSNTFTFQYNVDILYFSIQDVMDIGRSSYAPWKAFEAGMDEFHRYMLSKQVLREVFPNVDDFVTKKTYTVDTSGGIHIKKTKLGGLAGEL